MARALRKSLALRFFSIVVFVAVALSAADFLETLVAHAQVDTAADARPGDDGRVPGVRADKQDIAAAVNGVLERANAEARQGQVQQAYDLLLVEWQRVRMLDDSNAFAAVQSELLRKLETYGEQLPSARRAGARDLDISIPLQVQ